MTQNKNKRGFTLIEMLIVIGLIAHLATAVLVAVNPARQFKFARDTERKAHLATILNALGQNLAEHHGIFTCSGSSTALPSTALYITSVPGGSSFDLAPCLVPEYLAKMPVDPGLPNAHYVSVTDYDTGYTIAQDTYGHITLQAESEMDPSTGITVTR